MSSCFVAKSHYKTIGYGKHSRKSQSIEQNLPKRQATDKESEKLQREKRTANFLYIPRRSHGIYLCHSANPDKHNLL